MSKPEKIVSINTTENPSEAFDRVMRGVNLLADAVRTTLGPWGRNFILEKSGGRITNDGISIAREIQSKDEIEDLAIRIVRESAIKTNEEAGDGTTTATTLTQAILKEAGRLIARKNVMAKESVMSIRKRIETECARAILKLESMATPIETKEQLVEVARVSVEDEELATLIGEAQWDLGKDGIIVVEETPEFTCSIERVHGIRIDNGLGTSMVMNDQERQRLVLDDVPVILTNYTLQSLVPIIHIIQALVDQGKQDIVIVARAFSSEAIRLCMENHKNGIRMYPLQAPYTNQREVMKDLAAVLGGRYIHDEDSTLEEMTIMDVGVAKKIVGYRYSAIFTGNNDTEARLSTLKKELEGEPSAFAKKELEKRIAQLENGFALLKIGSTSDIDRKYRFDKAEDAVNAVRSAFQQGTVPGAGLAYKAISDELEEGAILKRPLLAPYQQIMVNGGITEADFKVEPWVRNSVKVERVALLNACRIAQDLVTVGGAVAQERPKPIDQLLANKHTHEDE